jgi:hypothetical protein
MSVFSLLTMGGVTADRLGDGWIGNGWKGHVAELLIYTEPLTSSQRKSIEDYLALKYSAYVGTVAAPAFTPNGGTFDVSVEVSLRTPTPGAEIRYTTDGSEPTETSLLYVGPFALAATTTVRARAFRAGWNQSPVAVASFTRSSDSTPGDIAGLSLWVKGDAGLEVDAGSGVEAWRDQSGRGNDLLQAAVAAQPVFRPDAANGLPLLHFDGSDDWLAFTNRLATIRTVFWVVREEPSAPNGYRFLLGDATAYDFQSGSARQIWSPSAAVLDGETRLNGVPVDGTTTDRPSALSVISLVTTGDVAADSFSRDRTYGRRWWGDLAELIVYERALSDGEREQVEDYLALKYAAYMETAAAPQFSPNGGTFADALTVSLSTPTPSAEVRYTTDGSEPTQSSPLYVGPFVLTDTTTVRARAFHPRMNPSPVSVAFFSEVRDPSPASIPGLVLWARADAGVTSDEAGHVSVWQDSSGQANDLTQPTPGAQPTVVPDAAGALPVVRFDGTDDVLLFTRRLTNIRTVFWVVREEASAPNGYRFLLGDANTYHFHSGSAHQIWSSGVTAAVKDGATRVNGVSVDGSTTNRPTTLSLISLVTTGDVAADSFSRDRTLARRWWGDLAELVIYDRPLTDSERKAVEDHLALKYALYVPTLTTPRFTPNGSTVVAPVNVTLSADAGADIRYTTDGSNPTEASALYVEPLFFSTRTTVKARAFRPGYNPSPVATATFLDGETPAPLRITGLKLWVKADAGVTAVGGFVSSWADQSGNGNHLVQATAANEPQFVAGEANGLPVVRFDGAGDYVSFTSRLTNIRSVFWVIRRSPAMTPGYRCLLGDKDTSNFSSDGTTKIWSASYTSTAIRSGETRVNGALVDGVATDRPADLSVISVVTTGDVIADAFSRDRGYGRSWWGDLAELIIYDRPLSDTERRAIEGYLASKYALYVPTVVAPTISPPGGRVIGTQLVQLDSATPGAAIRFTLDDSDPTDASPAYTGPIEVGGTTRIRARAFLAGWNPSAETVGTFFGEDEFTPAAVADLALWVRADAGLGAGEVASWRDQSGASNDLTQTVWQQRPRIVVDTASRMPVVRLDGAGDTLSFTTRLTRIRTAFWVIRRSPAMTPGYRMLLGDTSAYHFSSDNTTKLWSATSTNAAIRNGETRLNGAVVDGVTTDRPTELSVISLVTVGDVTASTFSRDRGFDYSWWGDLAELVVYERALSWSEVRAVEEYLAGRYSIELAP